ncbi:MAG TPA: 4-(cytidine 5'-diphospho)-2-C-methyl-D-erythritol kinase [Gaiellales bacterium]|jgi:4-diphosphocytidyl-2-C-methyl-D-erythritol kinase|nr:4-(cytidine 5'-diphospho)-2-C-methyl-D-erythritol kinase [Gaiellales bacterium]
MTLRAPAKVNLCLRVGPVRPDGYHRVSTLMQAVDLYDELELEPASEVEVEGFPDDTLARAALEALGETRRVRLVKRIPVSAGLGGGSSDAAAILRALRGERSANELHEIARALGTDVPFFLSGVETGFGAGRGDRIMALPEFPRGHAFVLVPGEGLSTADVYAATEPSLAFRAEEGELIRRMHTARRAADVAALMANDLEAAVLRLRPDVEARLAALRDAGALAAQVTGSGPTAFGLFEHRQAAEEAAAEIPGAIAVSPV